MIAGQKLRDKEYVFWYRAKDERLTRRLSEPMCKLLSKAVSGTPKLEKGEIPNARVITSAHLYYQLCRWSWATHGRPHTMSIGWLLEHGPSKERDLSRLLKSMTATFKDARRQTDSEASETSAKDDELFPKDGDHLSEEALPSVSGTDLFDWEPDVNFSRWTEVASKTPSPASDGSTGDPATEPDPSSGSAPGSSGTSEDDPHKGPKRDDTGSSRVVLSRHLKGHLVKLIDGHQSLFLQSYDYSKKGEGVVCPVSAREKLELVYTLMATFSPNVESMLETAEVSKRSIRLLRDTLKLACYSAPIPEPSKRVRRREELELKKEDDIRWGFQALSQAPCLQDSKKPIDPLREYCKNLAERDDLANAVGRDEEIERMVLYLGMDRKRNVMIVGEAGVGKTHLVDALQYRILRGDYDDEPVLKGKQILQLDVGRLMKGTKYRGAFEKGVNALLTFMEENRDHYILFIDEVHLIVGAGTANKSSVDAANLLKPALSRGAFPFIGATTDDEYHQYIARDAALARRFSLIRVKEPKASVASEMVRSTLPRLKKHYRLPGSDKQLCIQDEDEVAKLSVELSNAHLQLDRKQPDKALTLLDKACSLFSSLPKMVEERARHLLIATLRLTGAQFLDALAKQAIKRFENDSDHYKRAANARNKCRERANELLAEWKSAKEDLIRYAPETEEGGQLVQTFSSVAVALTTLLLSAPGRVPRKEALDTLLQDRFRFEQGDQVWECARTLNAFNVGARRRLEAGSGKQPRITPWLGRILEKYLQRTDLTRGDSLTEKDVSKLERVHSVLEALLLWRRHEMAYPYVVFSASSEEPEYEVELPSGSLQTLIDVCGDRQGTKIGGLLEEQQEVEKEIGRILVHLSPDASFEDQIGKALRELFGSGIDATDSTESLLSHTYRVASEWMTQRGEEIVSIQEIEKVEKQFYSSLDMSSHHEGLRNGYRRFVKAVLEDPSNEADLKKVKPRCLKLIQNPSEDHFNDLLGKVAKADFTDWAVVDQLRVVLRDIRGLSSHRVNDHVNFLVCKDLFGTFYNLFEKTIEKMQVSDSAPSDPSFQIFKDFLKGEHKFVCLMFLIAHHVQQSDSEGSYRCLDDLLTLADDFVLMVSRDQRRRTTSGESPDGMGVSADKYEQTLREIQTSCSEILSVEEEGIVTELLNSAMSALEDMKCGFRGPNAVSDALDSIASVNREIRQKQLASISALHDVLFHLIMSVGPKVLRIRLGFGEALQKLRLFARLPVCKEVACQGDGQASKNRKHVATVLRKIIDVNGDLGEGHLLLATLHPVPTPETVAVPGEKLEGFTPSARGEEESPKGLAACLKKVADKLSPNEKKTSDGKRPVSKLAAGKEVVEKRIKLGFEWLTACLDVVASGEDKNGVLKQSTDLPVADLINDASAALKKIEQSASERVASVTDDICEQWLELKNDLADKRELLRANFRPVMKEALREIRAHISYIVFNKHRWADLKENVSALFEGAAAAASFKVSANAALSQSPLSVGLEYSPVQALITAVGIFAAQVVTEEKMKVFISDFNMVRRDVGLIYREVRHCISGSRRKEWLDGLHSLFAVSFQTLVRDFLPTSQLESELSRRHLALEVYHERKVPPSVVLAGQNKLLQTMEEELPKDVLSQHVALSEIMRAAKRAAGGFTDPEKPLGVFMLVGPTGVGKSYTADRLRKYLWMQDAIKLQMSEYSQSDAVFRLIGSGVGYKGHEEGGELTNRVRRTSHAILALEELDQAHESVINLLYQIFDTGKIKDNRGREVSFANTFIIMTTNYRWQALHQLESHLKFGTSDATFFEPAEMRQRMDLGNKERLKVLQYLVAQRDHLSLRVSPVLVRHLLDWLRSRLLTLMPLVGLSTQLDRVCCRGNNTANSSSDLEEAVGSMGKFFKMMQARYRGLEVSGGSDTISAATLYAARHQFDGYVELFIEQLRDYLIFCEENAHLSVLYPDHAPVGDSRHETSSCPRIPGEQRSGERRLSQEDFMEVLRLMEGLSFPEWSDRSLLDAIVERCVTPRDYLGRVTEERIDELCDYFERALALDRLHKDAAGSDTEPVPDEAEDKELIISLRKHLESLAQATLTTGERQKMRQLAAGEALDDVDFGGVEEPVACPFSRPIINRMTAVVPYFSLPASVMPDLIALEWEKIRKLKGIEGNKLEAHPSAIAQLSDMARKELTDGARPIRRLLNREVVDRISQAKANGGLPPHLLFYGRLDEEGIEFEDQGVIQEIEQGVARQLGNANGYKGDDCLIRVEVHPQLYSMIGDDLLPAEVSTAISETVKRDLSSTKRILQLAAWDGGVWTVNAMVVDKHGDVILYSQQHYERVISELKRWQPDQTPPEARRTTLEWTGRIPYLILAKAYKKKMLWSLDTEGNHQLRDFVRRVLDQYNTTFGVVQQLEEVISSLKDLLYKVHPLIKPSLVKIIADVRQTSTSNGSSTTSSASSDAGATSLFTSEGNVNLQNLRSELLTACVTGLSSQKAGVVTACTSRVETMIADLNSKFSQLEVIAKNMMGVLEDLEWDKATEGAS